MPVDPILNAFDALVRHRPHQPLLLSPPRSATVEEVDRLAQALGRSEELRRLQTGRLVGLAAPNGPGFLAGFLALRRAGAVVALLDWRTPEEESLRLLGELGSTALLRSRDAWPRGVEELPLSRLDPHDAVGELAEETTVVLLSSGSTGAPRGIQRSSANLVNDDDALAVTMGLRPDDHILAAIPLSHSYGCSSVLMPALMRGSPLVVPAGVSPFDTVDAAERGGVTFLPTVPAYLQALLRMSTPPPLPASLRLVISAGAPLPVATAARFREVYGRSVHVFYGASEVGGICYDREGSAAERGTLGPPVERVEVTLEPVDDDGGDGAGVVVVRSPSVSPGYYPRPEACLAEGRFRTSDLGSFHDGELLLSGRVDDLINVRGKKVNPREVEQVLTALAGISEAVVLAVAAPEGIGDVVRAVVACDREVGVEAIQAWCRERLAPHKVPRSVVRVDAIPRTDRGKLDRAALRALAPSRPGDL